MKNTIGQMLVVVGFLLLVMTTLTGIWMYMEFQQSKTIISPMAGGRLYK